MCSHSPLPNMVTRTKRSTHDKTLELLTKRIEELTTQRVKEPCKGEKWCVNCRARNHSTDECRQCDFCAARGHLWENCKIRLNLMMREGQEVRMVSGATDTNNQSGGYSGGRGTGRGSWQGGRAGRSPRVYTCFSCGKEGHFAANCPDKLALKETPDVNLVGSIVSVNAITKSQSTVLRKDTTEVKERKIRDKGKQVEKDELAEQRKLAARLTEEFAKLKRELLECSSARQITKIIPKPLENHKRFEGNDVLMQKKAETQESFETEEKPATERQQDAVLDREQEPRGFQPLVQEQVIKPEKRVRFTTDLLASHWKQGLPVESKTQMRGKMQERVM